MAYTKQQLDKIYRRTSGYCHLCHKKVFRSNYGSPGKRGAWEVEHSIARANGGTDHSNNLFAACCGCNRDKSTTTTRTARSWNGKTKAPLCPEKREVERTKNTFIGAIGVGLVGLAIGGPVLGIVGAISGGAYGNSLNPDRTV
jgi:uncharacterized protein YcfJ